MRIGNAWVANEGTCKVTVRLTIPIYEPTPKDIDDYETLRRPITRKMESLISDVVTTIKEAVIAGDDRSLADALQRYAHSRILLECGVVEFPVEATDRNMERLELTEIGWAIDEEGIGDA